MQGQSGNVLGEDSQMTLMRALAAVAILLVTSAAVGADLISRLQARLGGEHILALTQWLISEEDQPLIVVLSSKPVPGSEGQPLLMGAALRVFRDTGSNLELVGEFLNQAAPLNQMVTKQDHGLLITTSDTGSSIRVRVFSYSHSEKKVTLRLEVGSKALPEVVYPARGRYTVAMTIKEYVPGQVGGPKPTTPYIVYFFDEKGGHVEKRLTWATRFSGLH